MKYGEVRTPRVPKPRDDRQDGKAEKSRFNAMLAINLFALNFSISSENKNVNITEVRTVNKKPKTAECRVTV